VDLPGARVLVTGASGGIGRAIAIEFARRQARVALVARSAQSMEEVARQIGSEGRAVVIGADLTAAGAADQVVERTIEALGGVDILVNNAGIGLHAGIAEASAADVEYLFRLNVLVPAALIRAVVPAMRAQRRGMVINIASVAGRIVPPFVGYYSATKFALAAIGEALRMEEGHRGIRVMNVFPGTTQSGFTQNQLGRKSPPVYRVAWAVPAGKVARRVASAVGRDERTVYVSLIPDRLGVATNWLMPWAVSRVLARWARSRR